MGRSSSVETRVPVYKGNGTMEALDTVKSLQPFTNIEMATPEQIPFTESEEYARQYKEWEWALVHALAWTICIFLIGYTLGYILKYVWEQSRQHQLRPVVREEIQMVVIGEPN